MNKMLLLPMAFLFILMLIGIVGIGTMSPFNPSGSGVNLQNGSSLGVNGSNQTINVPAAGTNTINLGSGTTILAILVAAIAVGILCGIRVLASGLSESAQQIIFPAVTYLAIWIVLSALSSSLLFGSGMMFSILWIVLTIVYIIGMVMEMSSGTNADIM